MRILRREYIKSTVLKLLRRDHLLKRQVRLTGERSLKVLGKNFVGGRDELLPWNIFLAKDIRYNVAENGDEGGKNSNYENIVPREGKESVGE